MLEDEFSRLREIGNYFRNAPTGTTNFIPVKIEDNKVVHIWQSDCDEHPTWGGADCEKCLSGGWAEIESIDD